jgi:hypothetical protein
MILNDIEEYYEEFIKVHNAKPTVIVFGKGMHADAEKLLLEESMSGVKGIFIVKSPRKDVFVEMY